MHFSQVENAVCRVLEMKSAVALIKSVVSRKMFCILIVGYMLINVQVVICDDDIVILKSKDSFVVGKKMLTILENKPYASFWKIPYAVPPLNELRFKAPKKHDLWTEKITYDYSRPYNDTCSNGLTEDCLYLSVHMPIVDKQMDNFTVIVWIHEQSNLHEPDFFIDEDVLVVTVSYRTSILGYLDSGDEFAEGNMGAKDVLMALKWIKDNLGLFNGDINKVTIIGSGQAASIVASCLVSNAAEDLFNRAIIQSGSALSSADFSSNSLDILKKLYWKLTGNSEFNRYELYGMLKKAKIKDLAKLSTNLYDSSEVRDRQRLIKSFGPVIEKYNEKPFLTKHPIEVYKNRMSNNNVDVMFGFNNLESIYKLKGFVKNKKLLKYLNYNFQYLLPFEGRSDEYESKRYREIKKRIVDFYFPNGTIGERSLRRFAKYLSDQVIYPIVRQARLHASISCNNVYVYRFSFTGRLNTALESLGLGLSFSGATAGDEICYLFKCKSHIDVYTSPQASNERQFIKKISRLWANFAKYGDPTKQTSDGLLRHVLWDPFCSDGKLKAMHLGKKIKMVKLPEEERVKFWHDLWEKYYVEKNSLGLVSHYEL